MLALIMGLDLQCLWITSNSLLLVDSAMNNKRERERCPNLLLSELKALFNNVLTFKNLSCMSLHVISVFEEM